MCLFLVKKIQATHRTTQIHAYRQSITGLPIWIIPILAVISFWILTWGQTGGDHWGAYEFYYNEALQGDVVNDAVLERDKKLEEKLNIEIEYNEQTKGDEMLNYARNSINAGSDDFDLLTVSINQAATLAKEGLLLDLNDYSDILNLKESYWDQSAINQFSIANHLYFTISDLTLVDQASYMGRILYKEYG